MSLIPRSLAVPRIAPIRLSPLSRIVLGALAAATLAAAGFAAYALLGPEAEDAQSAAPDWKPPTLAIVELEPPTPASADIQTLSRPIFSKNRRPAPRTAAPRAENAETAETLGTPSGLTVGAIVKRGSVSHAFVISSDAPDGEWKKVGDKVDAWTISAIKAMELILNDGERSMKLKLYAEPPASDPAPAPTPALEPPSLPPP